MLREGVQLEQPATDMIATQTSTYLVDTGTMRAYRETRQQAAAGGRCHSR